MFNLATTYLYNSSGYTTTQNYHISTAALIYIYTVLVALVIFIIASEWKVFVKAGRPGWAAIIPIYNIWVLFEIVDFPGWWAVFAIIPFLNIAVVIVELIAYFKLGKLFNKSNLFSVCIILFPFIFIPILGFGSSQIKSDKHSPAHHKKKSTKSKQK
jgi:magnesium-transporting ATPase (P-type)